MTYLYLTFDTDWVCDKILSVVVEKLRQYNLRATFFATHDSSFLHCIEGKECEIALHPNFDSGRGTYDIDVVKSLKDFYPDAVGTRSHSLFFSSKVIDVLKECNIRYESNIFLLDHLDLHPTQRSHDLISVPFNWSDDKHLELGRDFSLESLPTLDQAGLNVFNFHPIHLFLNTEDPQRYGAAKKYFNQAEIRNFRNTGEGMFTLFCRLCEVISAKGIKTRTLKELL